MSDGTKIEWTEATVNAVNGCSVISPGCANCYAMRLAGTRLRDHPSRAGLTIESKAGPVWNGTIRVVDKAMREPLAWKRPRAIFWNAHGDMFHDAVPDDVIDRCFAVMALTPHHTHQVLTKRSARMRQYLGDPASAQRVWQAMYGEAKTREAGLVLDTWYGGPSASQWPLPNVWLGVSVEDQPRADDRIPDLLATPAAVRWLSCEPLLGDLNLACVVGSTGPAPHCRVFDTLSGMTIDPRSAEITHNGPRIDWVVVGGESGPGARPMDEDWARSVRDQCAAAGVPFLFKQWGEWIGVDQLTLAQRANAGDLNYLRGDPLTGSVRLGRRAAGRLLDGVQHDGMPG